tara:strand:+ start:234 stop:515 length:282 start_codon:yes stop_codon:yes gene_type:complete
MNPYEHTQIGKNIFIRRFDPNDNEMFIWHRDKKDRIVKVISSEGWYLQIDNQLPIILEKGKNYLILKNEWHRIICGSNILEIEITELEEGVLK